VTEVFAAFQNVYVKCGLECVALSPSKVQEWLKGAVPTLTKDQVAQILTLIRTSQCQLGIENIRNATEQTRHAFYALHKKFKTENTRVGILEDNVIVKVGSSHYRVESKLGSGTFCGAYLCVSVCLYAFHMDHHRSCPAKSLA
jgi:hypothetical protein